VATGYEDWIRYRTSDPALALDRLSLHVVGLQEIVSGAKTMADGVLYDPQVIMQMLDPKGFIMRELNRLEGVVNRVGIARMQPTRRVDGGVIAAPDTGVGYGS
jgi:hypothetical protein